MMMASEVVGEWIRDNKDALTSAWIAAVRSDLRIQSDADLTETGLRDHIPAVIEEIAEHVRAEERANVVSTREARVHAYLRFRQGYRGKELIRELSLLRMTLLDNLGQQIGKLTGFAAPMYIDVARLVNLYIDEEMSYAISVYSEAIDPGSRSD